MRLNFKKTNDVSRDMSHIVDLISLPVGFFEVDHKTNMVSISKSLVRICEFETTDENNCRITLEQWQDFLDKLGAIQHELSIGQLDECLFLSNQYCELSRKWFRMKTLRQEYTTVGALIDVTEDMMQKQKLEFEKNFDPLTGLFNRTAFVDRANAVINENANKVGVVLFADLDNLKKMNDTYGHDFGDRYIQFFAECLSAVRHKNHVIGRISGDEFVGLIHGFETKSDARKAFKATMEPVKSSVIIAPNQLEHKVEASIGLAFYPSDSIDVDELIKYADYAMYEVKKTTKNNVREFNKNEYYESFPVIENKDLFDLFIEEERVRFAYQPIVSAKTGEVFAFEVLMRPLIREFKTPSDVIKMAKSKSKLYLLEKMTVNMVFGWMSQNIDQLGSHKIFINSIPSQLLEGSDLLEFKDKYKHLFGRMVMEMTESDSSSRDVIKDKFEFIRELGGKIGLDNFGVNYSHGMSMLSMNPEFLKVDMSLVRDVDKEPDKQTLVESIVNYASKRGIETIAEGIENYEEMKTVIKSGVNYIQGYYLAKPEFELCKQIDEDIKSQILECNVV